MRFDNNIETMFEVNYFQFKIKNWEEKKKELLSLMEERKLTLLESNYTTYDTEEDIDLSKKVKIILEDELTELQEIIGFNECSIDYAWFQEELKGMHHPVHNHGFGFSSVCYIDFDPAFHQPLIFQSPYPDTLSGLYDKHMPENVESGTILFFPSIINHFTLPNKTDVSRKILSFNLQFS